MPLVPARRVEDEQKVQFRSEAIVVLVPTVVADKSGAAVHGLKAGDFHLFENGREQTIATAEEIEAKGSPIGMETRPEEVSNVVLNPHDPKAVIVIVLDTVNAAYLDQRYGRVELIKYLSTHIESGGPTALVTISRQGLELIHNFTADPSLLVAALKKVCGAFPLSQENNMDAVAQSSSSPTAFSLASIDPVEAKINQFVQREDAIVAAWDERNALETTLQALLNLGWALSGIQGRKSVIWMTGGFPFQLSSPSDVPAGRLSRLYEQTLHVLNQANVALYPVDVRGVVEPTGIGDVSRVQPTPDVLSARVGMNTTSVESLRELAAMTGGRAFYNRNDLTTGFRRALADSRSYYMLTYNLDKSNRRPGWRKLKVTVDRSDVSVLARGGFFVTNAIMNAGAGRASDMSLALRSPFDASGLPVAVHLPNEIKESNNHMSRFELRVLSDGLSLEQPENTFDLDVLTETTTVKSKEKIITGKKLRGHIPQPQMAKFKSAGLKYESTLDLKPGSYVVRFVVRDNISGRIGTVTTRVAVN